MTGKFKNSPKYQKSFPSWTKELNTYNEGYALDQNEIENHLSHEAHCNFLGFMHGKLYPVLRNNQPGVHITDFIEWLNSRVLKPIYTPDGWTLLKFTPRDQSEPYYKIFATWRREDEKWRISSGSSKINEIKEEGDYWIWQQSSGSVYKLPIDSEGCYTRWQGKVLREKLKQANEVIDISIVTLESLKKADQD